MVLTHQIHLCSHFNSTPKNARVSRSVGQQQVASRIMAATLETPTVRTPTAVCIYYSFNILRGQII